MDIEMKKVGDEWKMPLPPTHISASFEFSSVYTVEDLPPNSALIFNTRTGEGTMIYNIGKESK